MADVGAAATADASPAAESAPIAEIADKIDRCYFSQALVLLEPLMKSSATAVSKNEARLHYLHARAMLGLKRTDAAFAETQAAVAANPADGALYRLLGEIDAARTQAAEIFAKPSLARTTLKDFQTAVQLAPDDAESQLDLTRYYINAPGIVGGGRARAEKQVALLAKLNPAYAARTRAEIALIIDKDYTAGEAALKQAVGLDATPGSLFELGSMYLDNGHPQQGLETFKTMTARFPDSITGWYWLGRCAAIGKIEYETGIAALRRYLAASARPDGAPSAAWAELSLAELLQLSGDPPAAKAALAKARADAPANSPDFSTEFDRVAAQLRQ